MNHNYIEQFDIVDRYLMGRLATEESEQFEEHFIDCPQCIDRLKTAKNFIQDLRIVAAQWGSEIDIYPQKRLPALFASRNSMRYVALAAACLLIIVSTGVFLAVNRIQRLQSEVNEANQASAQWEKRYEEGQQTASASDKESQKTQQQLIGQINELKTELQNERKQRVASEETKIEKNPLVYFLDPPSRDAQNPDSSVKEIPLPQKPAMITLLVFLEVKLDYKDYRVKVLKDQKHLVLDDHGFKPNQDNYLRVKVHSRLTPVGDYTLIAYGINEEGESTPISNYPFRIVKSP